MQKLPVQKSELSPLIGFIGDLVSGQMLPVSFHTLPLFRFCRLCLFRGLR